MEPMSWILLLVGLVVGLAAGYAAGRAGGRASGRTAAQLETRRALDEIARTVAAGRIPEEAGGELAELISALKAGWAPRDAERRQALREALERVTHFLEETVRKPLGGGREADAAELRERMDRALGSLQDLEFFLQEPGPATEGRDLYPLVHQVTREFASDQNVGVRVRATGQPVRALVNPQAFMDGLYLILHNAGRFGGGATVDVTVVDEDGRAVVRVRDRGPGFSEEAFRRAYDPFYSTSDDGLGLGLPHAQRVIEEMGGRIQLGNVPDGGAEVEISFPLQGA